MKSSLVKGLNCEIWSCEAPKYGELFKSGGQKLMKDIIFWSPKRDDLDQDEGSVKESQISVENVSSARSS